MGTQIIEAITSGLGLITDLASEFLSGFTTLVWVPPTGTETAGHLTPVAIFAFVMLGISVSFAVIKLVLNLIRGNSGMN